MKNKVNLEVFGSRKIRIHRNRTNSNSETTNEVGEWM